MLLRVLDRLRWVLEMLALLCLHLLPVPVLLCTGLLLLLLRVLLVLLRLLQLGVSLPERLMLWRELYLLLLLVRLLSCASVLQLLVQGLLRLVELPLPWLRL